MDSSAIAVLVELLQRIRKRNGQIVLRKPQPRVKGLLEIAVEYDFYGGMRKSTAESQRTRSQK